MEETARATCLSGTGTSMILNRILGKRTEAYPNRVRLAHFRSTHHPTRAARNRVSVFALDLRQVGNFGLRISDRGLQPEGEQGGHQGRCLLGAAPRNYRPTWQRRKERFGRGSCDIAAE